MIEENKEPKNCATFMVMDFFYNNETRIQWERFPEGNIGKNLCNLSEAENLDRTLKE